MATNSCHWLIMGKVEIGIHCYLTVDILTNILQKRPLCSPLRNTWILSKPLNLIGCYGNRKTKFAKKYSKIISSEAIRVMKLKLCRNVYNISLQKMCFYSRCWYAFVAVQWDNNKGLFSFFPLEVNGNFNLKFPLTSNEKSKNRPLLLLTAYILTNVLRKCSLSSPLPNMYHFCPTLWIWLVATQVSHCDPWASGCFLGWHPELIMLHLRKYQTY